MLESIKHVADAVIAGEMDFVGQAKAGRLGLQIMSVGTLAALIAGSIVQRLDIMVWVVSAACLITALVIVPSWPMYRRNLLTWQPHKGDDESGSGSDSEGSDRED